MRVVRADCFRELPEVRGSSALYEEEWYRGSEVFSSLLRWKDFLFRACGEVFDVIK